MQINLIDISKKYDSETIFDNFNLTLPKNKINCILGQSGCGKTTLLNILSNLTDYTGKIENVSRDVSYIFQEPRLLKNLTVFQNLDYILRGKFKDKNQRTEQILKYLSLVELEQWKEKFPYQLSGGMAQRVSMARAFSYPSDILLMDEAFSGLDFALKTRLIKVFLKLWEADKRTVIMVTHDIYEALLMADTITIISGKPAIIEYQKIVEIEKSERKLTDKAITAIRDEIVTSIE